MSTVEEIQVAIERLDVKEQVRLLQQLPSHLKISVEDLAALKLAETAFEFWDNSDDAAYDAL
jgi:hypothetical protein